LIRRFLDDWQQTITISEEALTLLQAYPWPGNIRELENELRRALVVADATIEPLHLSERLRHTSGGSKTQRLQGKLRDIVAQVEADAIQFALKQANGNKSETARKLGLSKRGLQLKMERYHISS
jgi:transcriptional regulator with PAS, ATPase and Fis domain